MEIVDTVLIPAGLAPGDYVLGWRYDCEESSQVHARHRSERSACHRGGLAPEAALRLCQVWASCSDVRIA
jgi:hypothetical protein